MTKVSLGFFIFTTLLSFFAELWINDKPLFLIYNNKVLFPIFYHYSPEDLGIKNEIIINYKQLDPQKNTFALWPLIRWNPNETDLALDVFPSPPSLHHFFGTDDRGRDLFARVIYGYRNTMTYGIICLLVSSLIGICFGVCMGFYGGYVDLFGMRVIEIIESIPQLFLILVLISIFEPSIYLLAIYLSSLGWVKVANLMRTQILELKNQEFIHAARLLGMSDFQIILKHMLPNSLSLVSTTAPFSIISFITFLSIVDFLGMGIAPPTASWGEIFQQAQTQFLVAPWIFWLPALFMFMIFSLLYGIKKLLEKNLLFEGSSN
ncbi:MAG: ABC transporter permease subunit [Deltaproteobacteria bacterium]|nr:ABC transporter permease subunit [Deltaproteobacteria bacterium]